MTGLDEVETWAGTLLSRLEPGARRQLAREMGRALDRSQRSRIKSQQNPDGSGYEPRREREQIRSRAGSIRRKAKAGPMFKKLARTSELGVLRASSDEVSVGIKRSRASAIARVHQEGLVDQVDPKAKNSPRIRYARRQLLGLSEADRADVAERIVAHLAK